MPMKRRASSRANGNAKKPKSAPVDAFPKGELSFAELNALKGNGSWSVRAHVKNSAGEQLSIFVSFVRTGDAFSVNFAVSDPANKTFSTDSICDNKSAAAMLDLLKSGAVEVDDVLKQALTEELEKGNVLLPARTVNNPTAVSEDNLAITLSNNYIKATQTGYAIECSNLDGSVSFVLNLDSSDPVLAANDGSVVDDTYSVVSRTASVKGFITINGVKNAPISGQGSFERRLERGAPADLNVMVCQMADGSSMVVSDSATVVVAADGTRTEYKSTFTPVTSDNSTTASTEKYKSTSVVTGEHFPCTWELAVPKANLKFNVVAAFKDQELMYALPARTAWTGRMHMTGSQDGVAILQQQRSNPIKSFENFVEKYASTVVASIDSIMPREPSMEEVEFLMSEPGFEHFMSGVSREVFRDCIITPLRDIVDRGSTSWRSLVTMMCIEAAGGNSSQFKHWLAMPEVMHVGSLIVDDIEDEDEVRRGGPAAHVAHGLDIAINSGTAAYFMSLYVMLKLNPELDINTRLKLYETYFVVLRAGHTGQALDMAGFKEQVEAVIGGEKNADLLERVLAVHRLQSAVPSACIAKMGALAAGGNGAVQNALSGYVEAVGMAASIVRSVHNLSKAQGQRPQGKEISKGKVTIAVAHALGKGTKANKQAMWDQLSSIPSLEGVKKDKAVKDVIAAVKKNGGDKAAIQQAEAMVEEGWKQLDSVLPASWAKTILRSFGLYSLSTSQWEQ